MSQRLDSLTEDPGGRLRATATAFTPNSINDSRVQAIYDNQHNFSIYGDSTPAPTARETPGEDIVETPNCVSCTSIGHLPCCEKAAEQNSCPHCTKMQQLFAYKDRKHQDEITTLSAKLAQLEKETPEEQFTRLCALRNVEIKALKEAAEKMHKKGEMVKAEIKEKEGTLKMLEGEIKKVLPVAEFTIREERKGKRK